MTTTTSPPEVLRTAWDVVVTDDGIDELSKQLSASELRTRALGLLATASQAAQQVLDGKLLDGFTQLLQRLDLMSLVIEGWRSYTRLIEAARQSCSTPNQPQKVVLSNHQLTSTHHPTIEVIVDETQRYAARLTVTLAFDFQLVRAIVQNRQPGSDRVWIVSRGCHTGHRKFP